MMRFYFVALSMLLAGCGSSGDPSPGSVSPSEAQALNDAAAMLDQTAPPPSVLKPAETNAAAPQSQSTKE